MVRRRKDGSIIGEKPVKETSGEGDVENTPSPEQETPEEGVSDDVTGPESPPWPLEEGVVGFYRGVRSRRYTPDGGGISLIQERLGVPRSGTYDEATAEAVRGFNAERGRPGSVVDRDTWDALFR